MAHEAVALGLLGVVAHHQAVAHGGVVDDDLFDPQVPSHGAVAALAGQRRLGLVAVAAELLADDVVPAGALQVCSVPGAILL